MVRVALFLILSFCGSVLQVHSQSCIPAETVFKLNFGSPSKPEGDYIMKAGGYNKVNDKCPQDGNYAIVPQTYSCFDDSWHKIYVDHSGKGGNFLLVNAADNPKRLIIFPVNNLTSDNFILFHIRRNADAPPSSPRDSESFTTLMKRTRTI
jgi:hypothetical protein